MKNRKKAVLLSLTTLILGISIFYAYFSLPYWDKSIHFKDISISNLKIAGESSSFGLKNGKIFQNGKEIRKAEFTINPITLIENYKIIHLAYFAQIEKEDAIFASNGVNIGGFQKAIDALKQNNEDFKTEMKVKSEVLPVGYLSEVKKVFDTRENFEKSYSADLATKMVDSYKSASDSYKKSVQSTEDQVNGINNFKDDFGFVEYGSTTSKGVIKSDLQRTIENSNLLGEKVSARRNCLHSILFCSRPNLSVQKPDLNIKSTQDTPKLVPEADRYYGVDENQLSGTYKVNSACWGETPGDYYIYLYKIQNSDSLIYRPELANTNYYEELKSSTKDASELQYLKDGLNWRYVLVTTAYACNDLGYQPALTTLDYFFHQYQNDRLFGQLASTVNTSALLDKTDLEKKKALEDNFFESAYPSAEEMDKLALAYFETYSQIVSKANESNVDVSNISELKDELLARYMVVRERMANIDGMLNYSARVNKTLAYVSSIDKVDRGPYVELLRNGYPLTYLGFSPSVYVNGDKMQYILSGGIRSDLKDYKQMLETFGQDFVTKVTQVKRKEILNQLKNSQ